MAVLILKYRHGGDRMIGRYWKDSSGNIGISFAIMSLPVLLAGGLSVDYIGLSVHRHALQNAVDAAALSVAHEGKVSHETALKIARDSIVSNFGEGKAFDVEVSLVDDDVTVRANAEQSLAFGGFIGTRAMPVAAVATATYASAKYEIAFVLDTTGSMAGGKLVSLQNAVLGLVADMTSLGMGQEQVKFAVVPYATFVNVGPQYAPEINGAGKVIKAAPGWLDQNSTVALPQVDLPEGLARFGLYRHLNKKWPGCVETRQARSGKYNDINDTVPDPNDPSTLFTPTFAIDEPDDAGRYPNSYLADGGKPANGKKTTEADKESRLARYGASGKYAKPKDLEDTVAMTMKWKKVKIDDSPSRFYSNESDPKGPGYGCETKPIVPLTADAAQIAATVKSLVANGSTNTLEGVMWGWRVLSDREPFTDGAPKSDAATHKVMIFVTDGTNSFGNLSNDLGSGYSSLGYLVDGRLDGMTSASSSQTNTALNDKTLDACGNAKTDGIEIYSIRLEEPNVTTADMLSKCASGSNHYFDAPSRQDLSTIFKDIRKGIVRVRLAS